MKRRINKSIGYACITGFVLLLTAGPSAAQKSGSTGGSRPSAPTGGSAPNVGQPGSIGRTPSQVQTPLFVNGRVLLNDTGQPAPEPVSVQLNCGMNLLQVIQTDLRGYFQFVLGAGPQGNANLSAADQTPVGMMGGGGLGSSGAFGRLGGFGDLTGCELRVLVDGYQPASHILNGPPELTTIDVGTLRLVRIAGVQGSAISVTSLLVPAEARKEFEKGEKDFRDNKLKSATEHLEKAVAEYDHYAAAWNSLGGIYASNHDTEKARQAFAKAIAADPKYVPPYVSLANLQLQNQEYQDAIDTAGEALDLNPGIEVASFLQALANFRLNRLDAAEKTAQEAQKGLRPSPQWHALLAQIFLQRRDYSQAASQMRAYLKESPKGPLAPQMKKSLDQIEASGTASDRQSKPSTVEP